MDGTMKWNTTLTQYDIASFLDLYNAQILVDTSL